jgi:hypothetical protein
MLYGTPGLDARRHANEDYYSHHVENDFDDAGPAFEAASPPFTVRRDRSLYLIAERDAMLDLLRARRDLRVTVVDGRMRIDLRRGSSGVTRAARTVLGQLKGNTSSFLSIAFATVGEAVKDAGKLSNPFAGGARGMRNEFRGHEVNVRRNLDREHSKLVHAMIEISCAAANAHGGALAASMRPPAGVPDRSANSSATFADVIEQVRHAL